MLKIVSIFAAVSVVALSAGCSSGPSPEEVCRAMKDKQAVANDDDNLTRAEYVKLRAQFAEVDDEELAENGVKLIDTAWQVQQIPEGKEMSALAFMGTIVDAATGVAGACAKYGVELNLMEK